MKNKLDYTIPTKETEYFCIQEYRDCGLQKPGGITIINGGRDIGKTTGTLIYDLRNCNASEQLFFIRNTEKEIDKYKETFNQKFGNEFIMTRSAIYTAVKKTWVEKKTGEEKTTITKGVCVGFVGALSGIDGWRSGIFDNVKYVYADEYNQIGNSLDAEKFMTLWTSILRTKDNVYTTIVGNRDDVAADLLIELGIDILIPDDFKGDWVVPLFEEESYFYDKAFFIDLDDTRFTNNNKPTIWKELGRKMEVMGRYYDRGYKSYDNADCKKLSKEQLQRAEWKFSYSFDDIRLTVGELNKVVIAHWDKEGECNAKMKLASIPYCAKNNGYTPLENNIDYPFHYLTTAMKNHNILYTSLVAKEDTNAFVNELAYQMDKKNTFNL